MSVATPLVGVPVSLTQHPNGRDTHQGRRYWHHKGRRPYKDRQTGEWLEYRTTQAEGQAPIFGKQRAISPFNLNLDFSQWAGRLRCGAVRKRADAVERYYIVTEVRARSFRL